MKNKYNKLTCLFGHHDYSKEITIDKHGNRVHFCKHCKRSGYIKWDNSTKAWISYDKEGNIIHERWEGELKDGGKIVCDK